MRRWRRTPRQSKAEIEWLLRYGEAAEYLIELAEDGRDVPALNDRPELTPAQAAAVEAFWMMNPARPVAVGMGGAIPLGLAVTEIVATARVYGFPEDWFLTVARAADRAYMEGAEKTAARPEKHGHRTPRGRIGPKPIPKGRK